MTLPRRPDDEPCDAMANRRPRKLAQMQRVLFPILASFTPGGATTKKVALAARMPIRTVSRYLSLFVKLGWLAAPVRGLYTFAPGTPDLVRDPRGIPGVHGLVLVSRNWPRDLLRAALGAHFGAELVAPGVPFRRRNGSFNGRHVAFCYYPGSGQVRIEVPANPDPIRPEEFPELLGWLTAILQPLDGGSLWVVQIGLHVDYPDIELKGVQGVQLRACTTTILQLYQKQRDLLRYEAHLNPKELNLRAAVEILWEGSPTARLERALRQGLELERLRSSRPQRFEGPNSDQSPSPKTPLGWGS